MPVAATALAPILVGSAILFALLIRALWQWFQPRPSWLDNPFVFFPLVAFALLLLHWRWITFSGELNNPDESQFIAQAMRFMSHPVPWRDVDTNTSGPLNSLFLTVPLQLGAPATWATARLVQWASLCLVLVFCHAALRGFGANAKIQLALMPTIFLYGFAKDCELHAFSSETLPVLLLSACLGLLAWEWTASRPSRVHLFFLGVLAGCVPFAKLQAAPIAVLLVALGFLVALVKSRRELPLRAPFWPAVAMLVAGGLSVPLFIFLQVGTHGALGDFWKSYIVASASYAAGPAGSRFANLPGLFGNNDFTRYSFDMIAVSGLFVAAFLFRRNRLPGALIWPLLALVLVFVLSLVCVALPGRTLLHYLYLLVPALALVPGVVLFSCEAFLGSESTQPSNRTPALILCCGVLGAALLASQGHKARVLMTDLRHRGLHPVHPTDITVAAEITRLSHPGDTLSVWGWSPAYYLQTGMPPATRDSISHYLISTNPCQDYFRARYLNDLKQVRPAFFVDAVASGVFLWDWSFSQTHESFPELAEFIAANYNLAASVAVIPDGRPVRIYMLKERAQLSNTP